MACLYRWERPSATFGYFTAPEKYLDLAAAARHRLSLARRPTGGGIVFHIWDLAFSFLMPAGHPLFSLNTLANYQFVNGVVLEVVKEFFSLKGPVDLIPDSVPSLGPTCSHFCMAKPTQYDVVYQGMKIAGAAQRRKKGGYLHQGTLSLALPHRELLESLLLSKQEVVSAMLNYTFAPLGRTPDPKALQEARSHLDKLLMHKFMEKLDLSSV